MAVNVGGEVLPTRLPVSEMEHQIELLNELRESPEAVWQVAGATSETVRGYAAAGRPILEVPQDQLAEDILSGLATVLLSQLPDGGWTPHYFGRFEPLGEGTDLFEFGTLVRVRDRVPKEPRKFGATNLIALAEYRLDNDRLLSENVGLDAVIIATTREPATTEKFRSLGWADTNRREHVAADALTCSERCRPGVDGRPAGIERVLDLVGGGKRIACRVNVSLLEEGDNLPDACHLVTNSLERLRKIERRLGRNALEIRDRYLI